MGAGESYGRHAAGRRRWFAAMGLSAFALLAATDATSAPRCLQSDERLSLEVRALQTEMMVAALSCHAQQEYNAFVIRHRQELARHGHKLKSFFSRVYGSNGERETTRFVTGLANKSALAGVSDMDKFCTESLTTLRAVHEVPSHQLDDFARARKPALGTEFAVCTASAGKKT
jgi:hypothetical protein